MDSPKEIKSWKKKKGIIQNPKKDLKEIHI